MFVSLQDTMKDEAVDSVIVSVLSIPSEGDPEQPVSAAIILEGGIVDKLWVLSDIWPHICFEPRLHKIHWKHIYIPSKCNSWFGKQSPNPKTANSQKHVVSPVRSRFCYRTRKLWLSSSFCSYDRGLRRWDRFDAFIFNISELPRYRFIVQLTLGMQIIV